MNCPVQLTASIRHCLAGLPPQGFISGRVSAAAEQTAQTIRVICFSPSARMITRESMFRAGIEIPNKVNQTALPG